MPGSVEGDDGVAPRPRPAPIGPHDRADWVKPWISTTGSPFPQPSRRAARHDPGMTEPRGRRRAGGLLRGARRRVGSGRGDRRRGGARAPARRRWSWPWTPTPGSGCTSSSTSGRPASWPSGWAGDRPAGRGGHDQRHGRGRAASGGGRGVPRRRAPDRRHRRPPAGAAPGGGPADRRAGRPVRRGRALGGVARRGRAWRRPAAGGRWRPGAWPRRRRCRPAPGRCTSTWRSGSRCSVPRRPSPSRPVGPGAPRGTTGRSPAAAGCRRPVVEVLRGPRRAAGLIVAGAGSAGPGGAGVGGPGRSGWPLLADPRSGCRVPGGPVVAAADALLAGPGGRRLADPTWCCGSGRPGRPRCSPSGWPACGPEVPQVLVDPGGGGRTRTAGSDRWSRPTPAPLAEALAAARSEAGGRGLPAGPGWSAGGGRTPSGPPRAVLDAELGAGGPPGVERAGRGPGRGGRAARRRPAVGVVVDAGARRGVVLGAPRPG